MERMNVMYVTEEEKLNILRNRLEAERKAKRRLTEHERTHRILGILLIIMAFVFLYIGGEGILGTILCSFFAIICLAAKEEDREEWVEQ